MFIWVWHQESGEEVLCHEYDFFPHSQIIPPHHPRFTHLAWNSSTMQKKCWVKNLKNKAGEMAQQVRCLFHKHGDLNESNPQKRCKIDIHYNSSSRKMKTSRSLMLSGQPAQANEQVPCKSARLSWKIVMWRVTEGETSACPLAFTYICTHVHSSMCVYVHVALSLVYFKIYDYVLKNYFSK